jgi:hypothetical protein
MQLSYSPASFADDKRARRVRPKLDNGFVTKRFADETNEGSKVKGRKIRPPS